MVAAMITAMAVPPTEDDVARAATQVSDGALADATVTSWPRVRDHYGYVLKARDGC